MDSEKIYQYQLLAGKIQEVLKQSKNRRNKKIHFINQVTDPSMTLINLFEIGKDFIIKKENLFTIPRYFEDIILPHAKLELIRPKNDLELVYLDFKNSVLQELNDFESIILKINAHANFSACTFFENFSNGILNENNIFLDTLEQLVVKFASNASYSPEQRLIENIKQYLENEKNKIHHHFTLIHNCFSIEDYTSLCLFPKAIVIKLDEFHMVSEWIKEQLGVSKIFEPLFNTNEHGFLVKNFHSLCDNKGPTIIFIETGNGNRFGGYAHSSWNSIGKWISDEKYLNKPGNAYAMAGFSFWGPTFGNNGNFNGFWIADDCNNNNNSGCELRNDSYMTEAQTEIEIAGGSRFTVKRYEVFLVKNKYH